MDPNTRLFKKASVLDETRLQEEVIEGRRPSIILAFVALVKLFHAEHPSIFSPPLLPFFLIIFCHILSQGFIQFPECVNHSTN